MEQRAAADSTYLTEHTARLVEGYFQLRDLGARVTLDAVPIDFDHIANANGQIIAADAWALHRGYIEDETLDIDPWVRRRVIAGKAITADQHAATLVARRRAMDAFADWMHGRDALLTPTLPITATALAEVDEATGPLATFTRVANYLGACALSLPAGLSAEGLPVGVQLLGAPFADASLVRIGRAFQSVTHWHLERPEWRDALATTPSPRQAA